MTDYRMQIIRSVETELLNSLQPEQMCLVSHVLTKVLGDYEITERCTSLEVYDDSNEKILKMYTACMLVDGKSDGTVKMYVYQCRRLAQVIGKPYTEMNAYDIRFFLAKEMERGMKDQTRENERAVFSAFFQWMANEELIKKNPIATIKPIKCHQEIKKAFTDVEIDAIRSACKNLKERALVEFLLSTGVRVNEASNMRVQDINKETLAVHVVHGKGNKERITYTTAVAMKHLLAYVHSRTEKGEQLFYNKNHQPLENGGIRKILKSIEDRAGVADVHPHRFRRTFATNLARRGMQLQDIKELMGHSNVNTTMTYISVDDSKVHTSYNTYIA